MTFGLAQIFSFSLSKFFRRGSALAELGLFSEAIAEFEAASRLVPSKKEEILKNVDRIKLLMENEENSD